MAALLAGAKADHHSFAEPRRETLCSDDKVIEDHSHAVLVIGSPIDGGGLSPFSPGETDVISLAQASSKPPQKILIVPLLLHVL